MEKEVSIIIVTWNALDYLKLCLQKIFQYTDESLYDLIIVNNGSTDGTKDFLKTIKAKVINNAENFGVVRALAQGENLVRTKFILSINDDVVVSPGWLKDLLAAYKQYPEVKMLAPIKPSSQLIHPYKNINSRIFWDEIKKFHKKNSPKELLEKYCAPKNYEKFVNDFKKINNYSDYHLECPPEILSGCCVLVEAEFMKTIGGFVDTKFKIYGSEDADRSWRIGTRGFKIMRTGTVYIHHFEGTSLSLNNLNWRVAQKRNNLVFLKKWHSVFWNILGEKIADGLSLSDVAKKYWFLKELLKVVNVSDAPKYLKQDLRKFKTIKV